MELIIKAPSYYEENRDFERAVIEMIDGITEFMKDKDYSETIKRVHIFPIIITLEMQRIKVFRQMVKVSSVANVTSVFRYISYRKYRKASYDDKKRLVLRCILESMEMIDNEAPGVFDIERFEEDLLSFIGRNRLDIYNYNNVHAIH